MSAAPDLDGAINVGPVNVGPVNVGEVYCVSAHPYIRWTVISMTPRPDAAPEIVLRSSADPAVVRVISLPVLQNPMRFQRVTAPS